MEARKPTGDMKFRLHVTFYIWTQFDIQIVLGFGHLIGTSSKCHKFLGQKKKKKLAEKAKKLNFTIFWALSGSANPKKFIFNKLELLLVWY